MTHALGRIPLAVILPLWLTTPAWASFDEGMPCRKSRAKPSEALTSRANYEKKHPPLNNSPAGFSTRPGFQLEGLWRFQWQPEPSQKSDVRFRG